MAVPISLKVEVPIHTSSPLVVGHPDLLIGGGSHPYVFYMGCGAHPYLLQGVGSHLYLCIARVVVVLLTPVAFEGEVTTHLSSIQ